MNERSPRQKLNLWLLIGVLLLSAALFWHDLGIREVLGRDENATITKLDQPSLGAVLDVTNIKITGQPGNMQPLYFLLQRLFWPLVGRSAFMLRFLSSVFGLLAVLFTFKLGAELFGPKAGLLGALLAALLPLHVRYAQIARPYSLLALLSLASATFLVRALRTNRPAQWAGFVLTATLNFYNHYNALFVLAVEGLFASAVWLSTLLAVRKKCSLRSQPPSRGRRPGDGAPSGYTFLYNKKHQPPVRLVGSIVAFLTLGVLCLPGLLRLLQQPWLEAPSAVEPGKRLVELTIPFFRHFLYMSGLRTLAIQNLIFGLTLLGLAAALYRRRWQAALLAGLWPVVPFVSMSLLTTPRPFEERYVIFVTPVLLLLIAHGVIRAGQALAHWTRRWNLGWLGWAGAGAIAAGLVLIFAASLPAYYANNRAADRLEQVLRVVERHAQPGDLVLVSPRFFARPLATEAEAIYLDDHLSPAELDGLAQRYRRMWILYSSYLPPAELQESLDQWVQAQGERFLRVPIKSLNALAYAVLSPDDAEAELLDRVATLEELARDAAGKFEVYERQIALADAYQALSDLYAAQGKADLAEANRARAEQARAVAAP